VTESLHSPNQRVHCFLHETSFPFTPGCLSHIKYPLLTKLIKSRWVDIALFFIFLHGYGPQNTSKQNVVNNPIYYMVSSLVGKMNQILCCDWLLEQARRSFIIWLAPWASKMNRILYCDWLPEQARWSYLALSGYGLCPARKIYEGVNGV